MEPLLVELLASDTAARLFLALLHFVWLGCLLALGLAVLLRLLPTQQIHGRCAASLTTLLLMLACPVLTFFVVAPETPPQSPDFASADIDRDHGLVEFAHEGYSSSEAEVIPVIAVESARTSEAVDLETSDTRWTEPARTTSRDGAGRSWVLVVWALGVVVLALRLLLSFGWTVSLRYRRQLVDPTLRVQVRQLARELGLRMIPQVWLSPRIRQAIVTGYLRPAIWLPASWVSELPPDVLEAVLAHELAHIKRWDVWTILLQRITETLLFYHPGVWWVSRCVTRQRELCCDTAAVLATGAPRRYAMALEEIARRHWSDWNPAFTPSIGGRKMELLARVTHVLTISPASTGRRPPTPRRHTGVLLASLLALVTVSGVILACGSGASEQQAEAAPEVQAEAETTEEDSATAPNQAAARARLVTNGILPKRPRADGLFDLRSIETIDGQLLNDLRLLADEAQSVTLGRALVGEEPIKQLATLEHIEHLIFVHADLEAADLQILKTMPKLRSLMIVKGTLSLPAETHRPGAKIAGWKIELKWRDADMSSVELLAAGDGRLEFTDEDSPVRSVTFKQLSLRDNLLTGTATGVTLDELQIDSSEADLEKDATTLRAETLFFVREPTAPFKFRELNGNKVVAGRSGRRAMTLTCDSILLRDDRLYFGTIDKLSQRHTDAEPPKVHGRSDVLHPLEPRAESDATGAESNRDEALITIAYPVADVLGSYTTPIFSSGKPDGRVPEASEILIQLISENIAPETWEHNGGDGAITVHERTRTLVIRQRQTVHDQIAAFLLPLRRLVVGPHSEDPFYVAPATSGGEGRADPVIINVAADGRLTLNDDDAPITLDRLKSELQQRHAKSDPDAQKKSQAVQIRADRAVPYQQLLKIINLCNELKLPLKFSLRIDAEQTPEGEARRREAIRIERLVWDRYGLRLEPLEVAAPNHDAAQSLQPYRGGLKITAVRPGSPAAQVGMRRDDVLVGLHVWETLSLKDVAYVFEHSALDDMNQLKFYIVRDGDAMFGHLPLESQPPTSAQRDKNRGTSRRDARLLFFDAAWCGPCQQMRPIVQRLQEEGWAIETVDVDRNRTLAAEHRITSIPTFLVIDGDHIAERRIGVTSEESLRVLLTLHLAPPAEKHNESQASESALINTGHVEAAPKRIPLAETNERLHRKVSLHAEAISLAAVLQRISIAIGVRIELDQQSIAKEGVTPNEPVTIVVDGISAKSALELILAPLDLDYRLKPGGRIIVQEADAEERRLVVRTYPIDEFLLNGADRDAALEQLCNLIRTTVRPDRWKEVGGPRAMPMGDTARYLVIRQTDAVHEEIAALLAELRRPHLFGVRPGTSSSTKKAVNDMIRTTLEEQRITLSLKETPLTDVLQRIASQTDVNVVLRESALAEEGITPETPLTLEVQNVPAAKALREILDPRGLTFVIENEVVNITSRFRALGDPTVKVYRVGHLLDPPAEPGQGADRRALQALSETITAQISPNLWDGIGSIALHERTGSLVIRHVPPVHQQIEALLDGLMEE